MKKSLKFCIKIIFQNTIFCNLQQTFSNKGGVKSVSNQYQRKYFLFFLV